MVDRLTFLPISNMQGRGTKTEQHRTRQHNNGTANSTSVVCSHSFDVVYQKIPVPMQTSTFMWHRHLLEQTVKAACIISKLLQIENNDFRWLSEWLPIVESLWILARSCYKTGAKLMCSYSLWWWPQNQAPPAGWFPGQGSVPRECLPLLQQGAAGIQTQSAEMHQRCSLWL